MTRADMSDYFKQLRIAHKATQDAEVAASQRAATEAALAERRVEFDRLAAEFAPPLPPSPLPPAKVTTGKGKRRKVNTN